MGSCDPILAELVHRYERCTDTEFSAMSKACEGLPPGRAWQIIKILWFAASKEQREDFPNYLQSKARLCAAFCDRVLPARANTDDLVFLWQCFDTNAITMASNLLMPGNVQTLTQVRAASVA